MEPRPSSPSVIELVLDVRLEYEVTFATQRRTPHCPTAPLLPSQVPHLQTPKIRPVATVHPANFNRKRDPSEENELRKEDFEFPEPSSPIDTPDPELKLNDSTCGEKNLPGSETVPEKSFNNHHAESPVDSGEKEETKHSPENSDESFDRSSFFSTRYRSYRFRPREFPDPCKKHRHFISRAEYPSSSTARKMECEDGHGCAPENQHFEGHREDGQREGDREVTITECLEEFLAGLHLSHLIDYLRVLGCTCVRDLRLLENSELEAIQLVSRRRLLQQLDSLKLHHEAPPEDCSLEGWLTWYGLTHISGFLKAIGVHTVADLAYVREEDLVLLKPVTRRRILACNKRWNRKSATDRFGIKENDYLM
ncbi:uncharacterized protein LOC122248121 isoform X2 [Penaeus japonicus]|uniref:uncharacterized protein LOC122248121 isoform X2 n=1 Tax=Penaeus japonicus TaxID=27405 RepID=UPI001C7133E4|nr:uncharacterized protein LOC122248121 isoform X2 [Penaeus japonicus]